MKKLITVLLIMFSISLGRADQAQFAARVSAGHTGVVSGTVSFTNLGYVELELWSPQWDQVAVMHSFGGSPSSWYNGVIGVSGWVDGSFSQNYFYWTIEGLPPGDYFIRYRGAEPTATLVTETYGVGLFDLLAYTYYDPSSPYFDWSQTWSQAYTNFLTSHSSTSAVTWTGDPTSLMTVNFGGGDYY